MQKGMVCLCAAVVLAFWVAQVSQAKTDFEYRNEESIEVGLTDRLSAGIEADFRFNDGASTHYYTSVELELNYEFLEWLASHLGKS